MTTPHNPNDPHRDTDELPEPPETAPWQDTGCRDENARLLVDAMHRRRAELARDFPFVPVQGYEVLPANLGETGALTCGVLCSLWEHSALCSGTCPMCDRQVLALSFGITDDEWVITGVCRNCGYLAQRIVPVANAAAAIDAALAHTPYTFPTRNQLISSNAHQHTALLAALQSLGEVLLPPAHFGFAVSSVENMRQWPSPVRARAWLITLHGEIRHVPSGGRLEHTGKPFAAMIDFAEEHIIRTGALPELEHDGPDQLRYSFPMVSQEPFVPPPRIDAEGSEWDDQDEEEDEERFQRDVDALVASVRAGTVDREALQRLTDSLDQQGVAYEGGEDTGGGVFLSRDAIANAYAMIDDADVRDYLELTGTQLNRTHRLTYLAEHVLPQLFEDADITRLFSPVPLTATDGHSVTLVAMVHGYSFSGVECEWMGPYNEAFDLHQWLRREGWFASVEEFVELSARTKVKVVSGQ